MLVLVHVHLPALAPALAIARDAGLLADAGDVSVLPNVQAAFEWVRRDRGLPD